MDLNQYIGKVVLLNISAEYRRENGLMLGGHPDARRLYALLKGVDSHGLWVENHNFALRSCKTGEQTAHRIVFLVPWFSLISVALFPDRTFDGDAPAEDADTHRIGF